MTLGKVLDRSAELASDSLSLLGCSEESACETLRGAARAELALDKRQPLVSSVVINDVARVLVDLYVDC